MGDSHGASIYPGFKALENDNPNIGVTQFTAAGCGGLAPTKDQSHLCQKANDLALHEISKLRPNLVVIHKAWHPQYFYQLRLTIEQLRAQKIDVLVVGPTPRWVDDLPHILLRYWKKNNTFAPLWMSEGLSSNLRVLDKEDIKEMRSGVRGFDEADLSAIRNNKDVYQKLSLSKYGQFFSANSQVCANDECFIDMKVVDADLKRLVLSLGGMYFSAYEIFCSESGCINKIPGAENALTTNDKDHITPAAARYLVGYLRRDFLEKFILGSSLEP